MEWAGGGWSDSGASKEGNVKREMGGMAGGIEREAGVDSRVMVMVDIGEVI